MDKSDSCPQLYKKRLFDEFSKGHPAAPNNSHGKGGITSPMHPLGLGRLASPGTSPTGSDSLAALPCRPTLGLTTVPVSAHETPRYDRVGGSLLYFLGQFVIPFCISAYQMCISYVSAVYQCFRTFAFLIRLTAIREAMKR